MKILHISDLSIGSDGFIVQDLLNEVSSQLRVPYGASFDYLVVCGNLTTDGQPTSFQQASQFLDDLAKEIFNDQIYRKLRIVIVPGSKDISQTICSYEYFQEFYNNFFAEEIRQQWMSRFECDAPIIFRDLKELTFIGTYDCSADGHCPNLNQILDDVEDQISECTYYKKTPTLLVTSGTPLLNWDAREKIYGSPLTTLLNNLKITIHLFGRGEVVCLVKEPFCYNHLSIGTGVKSSDPLWPFSMNVIDFNNLSYAPQQHILTIETYQKVSKDKVWRSDDFIKGQIDQFLKLDDLNNRSLSSFKELLFRIFFENNFINSEQLRPVLVEGFSSSGLSLIFDLDLTKIEGLENWTFYSINLEKINQNYFPQIFNDIKRIIDKVPRETSKLIVFIADYNLVNRSEDEIKKILEFLETLTTLSSEITVVPVYFTEPLELSISENYNQIIKFNEFFRSGQLNNDNYIRFPISFQERIEQEVNCILDFTQLPRINPALNLLIYITGEYAEFFQLVLNQSKRTFQKYSGAYPIRNETTIDLFINALTDQEIQKKSIALFRHIERLPQGNNIISQLRRIVRERLLSLADLLNYQSFPEILIGRDDLNIQELSEDTCQDILNTLVEYQILRQTSSDSYQLQVILPFYININTYNILIVYDAQFQSQAQNIQEALQVIGRGRNKRINVKLSSLPNDSTQNNIRISQSFENLILIRSSPNNFQFQSLRDSIVDKWLFTWGEFTLFGTPKAKFIPLVMDQEVGETSSLIRRYEALRFNDNFYNLSAMILAKLIRTQES